MSRPWGWNPTRSEREQLAGATTYTVYVTDKGGQVVATSDELPSDRKQWVVSKQLNRGGVFSWTVTEDLFFIADKQSGTAGFLLRTSPM